MLNAMRTLALAAAIGVSACGQAVVEPAAEEPRGTLPSVRLTATTLTSSAAPGGLIQVRFQNNGPEGFSFNPCNRLVERQEGEIWVQHPPELRICTLQAYDLGAGGSRTEATDAPADATSGTYRFVFRMLSDQIGSPQVELRSTPFTVR